MRATLVRRRSQIVKYRLQISILFFSGLGALAWAAQSPPKITVSQQGRKFSPSRLTISRSDTIRIVNDDADLLHHAFIESEAFNFDSGDQEPGSHTDITFPQAGIFTVLCGIHPKMKLTVEVK